MDTLAALDIGTSKVVCAVAEFSHDGDLDIVARGVYHCNGLTNGVLTNVNEAGEAIDHVIAEVEKAGYGVDKAIVGITGESVTSSYSTGVVAISGDDQGITKADIERVIKSTNQVGVPSGSEIVTVIPRGFSVDNQRGIVNPEALIGHRLEAEAYACVASSSYLRNLRSLLESSGIGVYDKGFIPSSVASSWAVLTEDEKSLGVMMVDMGLGTLDLAIYVNHEIAYSSVLGRGGSYLALDVAQFFNIPRSEAERVILEEGSASAEFLTDGSGDKAIVAQSVSNDIQVTFTRRDLANVLEAQLDEQLGWMKEQMEQASTNLRLNVSGIVLTGGTSLLMGLAQKARKVLGVPVRVAAPCYPSRLPQNLASPIYSTVVGLLLYGVANLPVQERKSKAKSKQNIFQIIADWLNKVF